MGSSVAAGVVVLAMVLIAFGQYRAIRVAIRDPRVG
jgi:hypothetical protein